MLKKFEVENFMGFADRLVFDLSARDYSFNEMITYNGVVNKAIIYGRNGVGKSALGLALFDIISHLTDKTRLYIQNYRNLDHSDKPVLFKYCFKFGNDDILYEYQKMEMDDLRNEKLTVNGKVLIDYDFFGDTKFIDPKIKGSLNIDLIDNKLSILKYIYKNTPTNSKSPVSKIISFCDNMLWYRSLSDGNSFMGYTTGASDLTEILYQTGQLSEFEKFLNDNGLNYKLKFESINGVHVLYALFNEGNNKAPFVQIASTGTKALLLFFSWKALAFNNISFLFIDEFDAFLHYESSELIVKTLNSLSKFQTVLTTHNTYLMQNKLTRPDCCFIMTRNKITSLYNATEKEIREAHNLEKMYINGAFTE